MSKNKKESINATTDRLLFIETYGCQMNVADSEVVASIMEMAGYAITDNIEDADAILLNTCSIRDNAEQKIVSRLQFLASLRRKGRKIIVGVIGCMAERVKDTLVWILVQASVILTQEKTYTACHILEQMCSIQMMLI